MKRKILSYLSKTKLTPLFILFALISASFDTTAQAVRGEGIVNTCGRLQVSNAHVCAENGTPVSLGGMSFFWSGWASKYYNATTVNYLVDNFKVSIVRAAYGVPADSGPMGDVQDIRNVIEAAIARDIYVIIDWHCEGDETPYKAQAKSFFADMIRDYGDHNNIIFELWNEPTNQSTSVIQAYCQELTNHIRATENQYGQSHKLIICGSHTWSQYPNSYQISDPNQNVAYTFHGYFDNQSSHLSQLQNNVAAAMNMGNAVFVTEYGASYCNHANTEQAIQWCQDNNISMTAWSVNDKPEDWSIFTNNLDGLTCVGGYYKDKIVNWKAANVVITKVYPTAVSINPSTVTIPSVGTTTQLTPVFTPANTTEKSVTWSSSNTNVATVSASGLVTAIAAGTSTITVNAKDQSGANLSATCMVTVKNLSNIALNKSVTVSSTESGATVSVIGSNAVDGNQNTRWSSVASDPQWIQIDLGASNKIYNVSLNWEAASAKDYTIQVSPDGVTWSTLATKTGMPTGARVDNISVNGTGRYIKMLGTARTTVYGYSLWEFSVYGEPGAQVAVTGVSVAPTSITVGVNGTSQLTATVSPSNASNQNVTWSSSNPSIATVNATGLVTGVSKGNASITAQTVDGGFVASSSVTVTDVTNLLNNASFNSGLTGWSTYIDPTASGTFSVENGELKASIASGGSQVWHVQAYQGNLNIVNGQTYTLSFTARGAANRTITAVVEQNGGAYTLYGGGTNNFNITTTNATYSLTFTMNQPTDANGRVTFNLGNSATEVYIDNVVLSTSTSAGFNLKLEAESYALKSAAPQAETTTDIGGGKNMGWIGNGDYLIYNVNVPTAGTYTISYRIASPNSTGKVILGKNGTDLTAAISVPNTGGWQNWQTIATTANLAAGEQQFTVFAQTGGFNINWWSISNSSGMRLASPEKPLSLNVYPNPTSKQLRITSLEELSGMEVKIFDNMGMVVLKTTINTDFIDLSDLKPGIYTVRFNKNGKNTFKRIVKQ